MALLELSTASCETFSVSPCLCEDTKKERTTGGCGVAEPGVFGWEVSSRRPLNRSVRSPTDDLTEPRSHGDA